MFEDIPTTGYDDSEWDTVSASSMNRIFNRDDFNGMVWFRKEFTFDGDVDKEGYTLVMSRVEDLDATFLNGKLIGRNEKWGKPDSDYPVPPGLLKQGKNVLAVRVIDVWGTGGIVGEEAPVILSKDRRGQSLSGEWKYMQSAMLLDGDFYILVDGMDDAIKPEINRLPFNAHTPSVLYNAMIAPLIPYTIKGAIWYQGGIKHW